LFRQSDAAQSVILLESGWIKLARLERDGRERIIALCPPGSLLGAEVIIAERPHTATAIALRKCKLYSIPAKVFIDWASNEHQFLWQILRGFTRRIYASAIHSAQLKSVPSRLRLEQLLWQLLCAQKRDGASINGNLAGEQEKLLIPLNRRELAQMISVTPEYLSYLLSQLEKNGVIHRQCGWLVILDSKLLWRAPEIEAITNSGSLQHIAPDLHDLIMT
jgi:CRP-like cAMP-binding protein